MSENFLFRPSTLLERKKFYETEFSIQKIKEWFDKNKLPIPQLCAIDAGTDTKLILNKEWDNSLFYFPFNKLTEKIKKYIPEDVYYDKNTYFDSNKTLNNLRFNKWETQEFVFDLDTDNLNCKCKQRICNECLNRLYKYSLSMKKLLKKKGFAHISIVYSGSGFHVHIFDKKASLLTKFQRKEIIKEFSKFPLDPWVSQGNINLIRMPYSLNGSVSRKCIPSENKFNLKSSIPNFLKVNLS